MVLTPANASDLAGLLAEAGRRQESVERVDLAALNQVIDYAPEDLTVTVEAGLTLAALQDKLRVHGQWLPVDPPGAGGLTVAALIDANASGPRRYGHGTVREHLLGVKVALGDGRVIRSGGKVVKNVAGYDLHKLFVAGQGSLGIVIEASFKLRPLPEQELFLARTFASLAEAQAGINAVLESELTPVVLDLHNIPAHGTAPGPLRLVTGFAGMREEVAWQAELAGRLGLKEESALDYEEPFLASDAATPARLSVLPSRLTDALAGLGGVLFVARAGNGVIYHRGAVVNSRNGAREQLSARLKAAFDPRHILPELRP